MSVGTGLQSRFATHRSILQIPTPPQARPGTPPTLDPASLYQSLSFSDPGRAKPRTLNPQSRSTLRIPLQNHLAGSSQGLPVAFGDLLHGPQPPEGLRGEDTIRVPVHHPFQESQGLGEPTPPEPHQSLAQVEKGKKGMSRDDPRPVQESVAVRIQKEEGGCPEGPIASGGLPVLAQIELQGNEALPEGPGDVFMGERFGIQPSTFRSRIFREVEEDGFPLGPALFQGLIQILRPFKAHLYLFCRVLHAPSNRGSGSRRPTHLRPRPAPTPPGRCSLRPNARPRRPRSGRTLPQHRRAP